MIYYSNQHYQRVKRRDRRQFTDKLVHLSIAGFVVVFGLVAIDTIITALKVAGLS